MNLDDRINPKPPEKIYGWRDTQLSIARHYGGMKFRGASYLIDFADPLHPLVRQDVLEAEKKAAKAAKAAKAKQADTTQEMFQA